MTRIMQPAGVTGNSSAQPTAAEYPTIPMDTESAHNRRVPTAKGPHGFSPDQRDDGDDQSDQRDTRRGCQGREHRLDGAVDAAGFRRAVVEEREGEHSEEGRGGAEQDRQQQDDDRDHEVGGRPLRCCRGGGA
ncbi:hypothetical protein [Mycobacterium sp. 236(2023)]|uniref:hypothetical protein n=1 Tax=Mycobacterium sp. 236(2023) TaxID=3038163 RepID=UPI0032428F43